MSAPLDSGFISDIYAPLVRYSFSWGVFDRHCTTEFKKHCNQKTQNN